MKKTQVRYGIDGDITNPNRVTVLVEEGTIIRLVFEPTKGTATLDKDVNFFDYDITDGSIYTSNNDANTSNNKHSTSEQSTLESSNSSIFVNTKNQGINNPYNYSNAEGMNKNPKLAFGNANTGTTLDSQELNGNPINQVNGGNRFGAKYWSSNADATPSLYYGSNLQGASFGLVTKVNGDGTLGWNSGLNAPALFSLNEGDVAHGKTIYKGITAEKEQELKNANQSVPENYSLQFDRVGGTYTLIGVNRDDTGEKVLENLDKLPPCKREVNKSIHTNEFWPLDHSGSYGTDGHDPKFGNISQKIKYANSQDGGALPTSDNGLDHNSYFGMLTKIPFKLEENYCAPLRYFFYGDDDMFVFLNKLDSSGSVVESKQIADLGGVHSSMGTYVNLWDFIDPNNKEEIKDDKAQGDTIYKYIADKTIQSEVAEVKDINQTSNKIPSDSYELAVYYLERGASGSSCYMRFSVPFEGLALEEDAMNGQVQVDKEVKHSLLKEPESDDEYVFQLQLEAPDGSELNNQYKIDFYQLTKNDQNKIEATLIPNLSEKPYIAPNGTFKLKNNQRALISGLPQSGPQEDLNGSKHEGYYYKVAELGRYDATITNEKYAASSDDNLIHLAELSPTTSTTFRKGSVDKGLDKNYQEGTSFDNLIKEENYVQFINAEDPGTIRLKKELADNNGNKSEDFTFNVTLKKENTPITKISTLLNTTNEAGKVTQTQEEYANGEGKYSLKVAPNQERILYNIPLGTQYEISEVEKRDESGGRYQVSAIKVVGNHTHDDAEVANNLLKGVIESIEGNKPTVEATFVNTYHKIAEVNIPIQKTITGGSFEAGETYSFELKGSEGAPLPKQTKITIGNKNATSADETINTKTGQFGPIVFDDTITTGTHSYTYTIQEIANNEANIQYDNHSYEVIVEATKDDTGNVSAAIKTIDGTPYEKENGTNLTFTNDKVQPIQVNIPVQKIFNGRTVTDTDQFTFRITEEEMSENPKRLKTLLKDGSNTLALKQNAEGQIQGNFTLGDFDLDDVNKTYKFFLEEVKGNDPLPQVEYDTRKIPITLSFRLAENATDHSKQIVPTITQEENATVDMNQPVQFTNTYHAINKIRIPIQKTLEGRDFTVDDRFIFEIVSTNGAPMPEQTQLTITNKDLLENSKNTAQKEFVIELTDEQVKPNEPVNYTYTVQEKKGQDTNVQYDSSMYTIEVSATNTNGKITTNIQLKDADGNSLESTTPTFTNVYHAPLDASIPIQKTLNGRTAQAEDLFTFHIRGDERSQSKIKSPSKQTIDLTKDTKGAFNIGEFTLAEVGNSYDFVIQEEKGDLERVDYDTSERKVRASVHLNADGKLQVDLQEVQIENGTEKLVPISSSQPLTITNTYHAIGKIEIPVEKKLVNKEFGTDIYRFEIQGEEGQPLPENKILEMAQETGKFVIPLDDTQVPVGEVRDYTYTITEQAGNDPDMIYDSTSYTVKIQAENKNGTITSKIEEGTPSVIFTNTAVLPATTTIPIQKTITGREVLASDNFTFRIRGNAQSRRFLPDKDEISIKAQVVDGKLALPNAQFELGPFTKADTGQSYTFLIDEIAGTEDGMNYDPQIHTITITPKLKGSTITFDVKENETVVNEDAPVAFTNTYQPKGTLRIPVTKKLEGRTFTQGDRFLFEITGEKGAPMPTNPILSILPTSGNEVEATFAPITYTKIGDYTYTIKELSTGLSGMNYDPATYTVQVKVSQGNGTLVVEPTYSNPTTNVETISFTNTYKPEESYAIPVTKNMIGRPMEATDQFVFTLEAITPEAPMPEHEQVSVQGNGAHIVNTTFDPIIFDQSHAGKTFEYVVKEHRGSIEHIKYSSEEYVISIQVTYENGNLKATPTIYKQNKAEDNIVDSIQFTNTYQPSGTWRPTLFKQLLGASLQEDAYQFKMHVEKVDDPTIAFDRQAKNNADGTINFALIEFEQPGLYSVTIQEVEGKDETIQYALDPIEYMLEVKDENGTLRVEEKNREQDHVFTNDAGLRISKQLIPGTGQTLDETDINFEFPFELDLGTVLANQTLETKRLTSNTIEEETIQLDANGKVEFSLKHEETLIVYGLGQQATYTIEERTKDRWIDKYLHIDTIGSAKGTISNGIDAQVTFRNLKPSTDNAKIHGFKTMDPASDFFEMKGQEFQFKISAIGTETESQRSLENTEQTIQNEPSEQEEFEEEPLDESFHIYRSSLPIEETGNGSTPNEAQKKLKLPTRLKEIETMPAQDTPLPERTTTTNNAFGRFEFDAITYTKPGRYVYEIQEINNQISGMSYETTHYKAIVNVTQRSGTLHVDSIQYTDMNDQPLANDTIVFTNTYKNIDQKPQLSIEKNNRSTSKTSHVIKKLWKQTIS